MSISDLYSSGKHKQDLGHFASIVKIAKDDSLITEGEQILLDRTASRLNISEEEYKKVLDSPEKYPINAPVSYEERIERLFRLAKMVLADGKVDKHEVSLMRKIAIGLHFRGDNTEKVCDEAIHLIINENDLEDFSTAIKRVNNI